MEINCSIIIIIIGAAALVSSNWTPTPTPLPTPDDSMAAGHYNNSIFILGGYAARYQLIEYDIQQTTFIYDNISFLSYETFGLGQFYTQIDNELFMISPEGSSFSLFNLKTKIFTSNWNGIVIDPAPRYYGCLASTEAYLFVVGGSSAMSGTERELQILNISANKWLQNINPMTDSREDLSCIVHPSTNKLFAIGGWHPNQFLDSIEYYDIGNITQSTWIFNDYNLLNKTGRSGAILYYSDILVIGGYYDNLPTTIDLVQRINPITGEVTLYDYLDYSTRSAAVIMVNNIAYAFGGVPIPGSPSTDQCQYSILPTIEPTTQPTSIPTTSIPNTSIPTTSIPTTSITTRSTATTLIPTKIPTNILTSASFLSTIATSETTVTLTPSSKTNENNTMLIVVIIAGCVTLLCVIFIIICIFRKHKLHNALNEEKTNKTVTVLPLTTTTDNKTNNIGEIEIDDDIDDINNNQDTLTLGDNDEFVVVGDDDNLPVNNIITPGKVSNDKYSNLNDGEYVNDDNNNERIAINKWLKEQCNLVDYYNNFIFNGYESLDIIKRIENKSDLADIGITLIGHQSKIFAEIKKLGSHNYPTPRDIAIVTKGNKI